jgi:phenylalanyl-tRNA synthetase beta chain
MAVELAGGEASDALHVGQPPELERPIAYRPERAATLGGIAVPEDRQTDILQRLGFTVAPGEPWQVTTPSWRRDVEGEADIVEEVIRVEGLDRIESTRSRALPASPAHRDARAAARAPRPAAPRRARLNEAVTWSFISQSEPPRSAAAPWILANPISEDMKAMRPSLLPGLLAAARRNQARGAEGTRLFEIGRRYLADAEPLTLGIAHRRLAGPPLAARRAAQPTGMMPRPRRWRCSLPPARRSTTSRSPSPAGASLPPRPLRAADAGQAVLAQFGELHPRTLRAFDLDGGAAAAELYLDALPARRGSGRARPAYAPPALQPVRRDFAFLLPEAVEADRLLRAVRGADKAAITSVALFDVFTGAGVAQGEKSLAVEVVLQPSERSFSHEELTAISDRIVAAAAKLGARLRV